MQETKCVCPICEAQILRDDHTGEFKCSIAACAFNESPVTLKDILEALHEIRNLLQENQKCLNPALNKTPKTPASTGTVNGSAPATGLDARLPF